MVERSPEGQAAGWLGADIAEALAEIRVPAYVLDRNGVIRWENARSIDLFGDKTGRHFTSVVGAQNLQRARDEFLKKMLGTARTSDYPLVVRGRVSRPRPSGTTYAGSCAPCACTRGWRPSRWRVVAGSSTD